MSDWIALTRDPVVLATLMSEGGYWEQLRTRKGLAPWTDDYASIMPVLNDPLNEFRR